MTRVLSWDEQHRFGEAIGVDNAANPFPARDRPRNHALWMTYYHAGITLSEATMLRTSDLTINGPVSLAKYLVLDADGARPRPIQISQDLAHILYRFIVYSRRSYAGASRSPYVFVADGGGPMEEGSVQAMADDIGRVIGIEKFSVEMLRATWDQRLAAVMDERGIPQSERPMLARYARGWRPDPFRDGIEEIEMRMQDKLFRN